jgi:SOS-response transcriptional repressor LexA
MSDAEPTSIDALFILTGKITSFTLRDNALAGDGLYHGDQVLIDPSAPYRDGDIGLVRTKDNRIFIQHVYGDGNGFRLVPSNPDPRYAPTFIKPDKEPVLVGRAVAFVRRVNG